MNGNTFLQFFFFFVFSFNDCRSDPDHVDTKLYTDVHLLKETLTLQTKTIENRLEMLEM